MKYVKLIFFLVLFCFLCFKSAFSQELIKKFHDWSVFKADRGDKIVCYAVSTPIEKTGNYIKRGESFFLVTNIENDADEISVSSGFYYSKNYDVEISFGSRKFYLFPYKTLAWANNKNDDIDIIKYMQKKYEMTITGIEEGDKTAIDTYSLIGFKKAYEKLREICEN
jgi:hypothetical protein